MRNFKGDQGRPLGIKPTALIVPSSLEWTAKALIERELINAGESNDLFKTIEIIVPDYLA